MLGSKSRIVITFTDKKGFKKHLRTINPLKGKVAKGPKDESLIRHTDDKPRRLVRLFKIIGQSSYLTILNISLYCRMFYIKHAILLSKCFEQ